MDEPTSAFRPHGGYRRLRSFQVTQIIYDATLAFCDRFLDKRSRTHDQMVQAARSGRQNIGEGSQAAATSSESEMKLTNVARASLDELLLDYEDYLRQHQLPLWSKNEPTAIAVRQVAGKSGSPQASAYALWLNHADPTVVANALICLIHQAHYLLDRQLAAQHQKFIQNGGFRERLSEVRRSTKREQSVSRMDHTNPSTEASSAHPLCPACNKPMVLRTARSGANAGSQFWGCSAFPACRQTRTIG
jgi:restriction system protein